MFCKITVICKIKFETLVKDMHVLYVLSLWRMEGEIINKNEGRRVFFHKYECQNRFSQLIHMKTIYCSNNK